MRDAAKQGPGHWFRATNRLNVIIWSAPVPRRLKVLLSQFAFRNPPMPQERVIETLAALERAGVRTAIMGGWGVDALAGRELRSHHDLDLLTESAQFKTAIGVLAALGYESWNRSSDPDPLGNVDLLATETLRDSEMRVVDLHSVKLDSRLGLSTGRIGATEVVCISPQQQLACQTGRAWTWGRLQRRRAMYATMTALMGAGGGADLLSNAGAEDPRNSSKPSFVRTADEGEKRDTT